jgi:ABC-type Fe3+ transport system permease subunit
MSSQRILGLVLLALGVVLLLFGLNATDSVADSVSEGVTGKYTDETMWYLIGGGVLIVVGGAIAFLKSGGGARTA